MGYKLSFPLSQSQSNVTFGHADGLLTPTQDRALLLITPFFRLSELSFLAIGQTLTFVYQHARSLLLGISNEFDHSCEISWWHLNPVLPYIVHRLQSRSLIQLIE